MNKRTVETRDLTLTVAAAEDSARIVRPDQPRAWLSLAHGAGAGMTHAFMERLSLALADQQIATLRYNFVYMEQGRRFAGPLAEQLAAVEAALAATLDYAGQLPVYIGGKSMGSRMSSTYLAQAPRPQVRGLVCFGFPLHPAKKPSRKRAEHLPKVTQPMLFIQGTRDALAPKDAIAETIAALGDRATIHFVEGADHGFSVLKRSGRSEQQVMQELAQTSAGWMLR